jgi:hypothetical protein
MGISPDHAPLLWSAIAIAALAGISLLIGLTLLFGTVPHQRLGLRLVWISAGVLASVGVAATLIFMHS